MSYEDAPGTKLLATHCCCCQRPLLDAQSVELGIGPVCRKKHGWDEVQALTEEARVEANKLVHLIACKREGAEVVAACKRLFELGAIRVVTAILERVATVQIGLTDDTHPHGAGRLALKTPYIAEAVEAIRHVPGRRWDAKGKLNTFPQSSRAALYAFIKQFWTGQTGIGPKGPFIVGDAGTTAATVANAKLPAEDYSRYIDPGHYPEFQKLGGKLSEAEFRNVATNFFRLTLDAFVGGSEPRDTAWEAFGEWLANFYPATSAGVVFHAIDNVTPYT